MVLGVYVVGCIQDKLLRTMGLVIKSLKEC